MRLESSYVSLDLDTMNRCMNEKLYGSHLPNHSIFWMNETELNNLIRNAHHVLQMDLENFVLQCTDVLPVNYVSYAARDYKKWLYTPQISCQSCKKNSSHQVNVQFDLNTVVFRVGPCFQILVADKLMPSPTNICL